MVTTQTKSAEQDQLTPKLPDLQIKVRDIFKTSDIQQLIRNTEKVLDDLEPAKLRKLQNTDQSIINLKNSRKQSVIADKDNILRMKVHYKGDVLEAILLLSPQTLDHRIHTQILWTSRRRQMLQQN